LYCLQRLKKDKTQGSIYWDESSRGVSYERQRGRWVGERRESGKRVRFRSTDYGKVVAWVTGSAPDNNRIPLRGMDGYSVDIERKEVFGKRGNRLTAQKNSAGETMYTFHFCKDRFSATFNRIAYAALHDIDVRKIPQNLVVTYKDGEYVLMYRGDLSADIIKKRRADNRDKILNTLTKRRREIDILSRFYTSGNSDELVKYATQTCFGCLVLYVKKERSCSLERATDVVLEATEIFLHRVVNGNVPVISISTTIQNICRRTMKDADRRQEYNDNIKIEE
jgi:hypothetical protein